MSRDPDPGSATPEALARANSTGWDEGTNYSRERSLNCLYAVTGDDRLIPALRARLFAVRMGLDEAISRINRAAPLPPRTRGHDRR